MLRVGTVPYLVARPLDGALRDEPGIDLVRAVPARLVDGLRSGELDVALVSSIEMFRGEGYSILDGLAVAGEGFVSSVQVFLRKPLEEVATVALDPASRTAAVLARVVWPEGLRRPRFLELEDGRDPRAAGTDAWLRIGDQALREHLAPDAPAVFNPSAAWRTATDLPFVFAVWLARSGVDLAPWADAFARAWMRGRSRLEELAGEAVREWNVPSEAAQRYFHDEVLYRPGGRLMPSLLAFRDRAAAIGLCRGDLVPATVPVPLPDGTGAHA